MGTLLIKGLISETSEPHESGIIIVAWQQVLLTFPMLLIKALNIIFFNLLTLSWRI